MSLCPAGACTHAMGNPQTAYTQDGLAQHVYFESALAVLGASDGEHSARKFVASRLKT